MSESKVPAPLVCVWHEETFYTVGPILQVVWVMESLWFPSVPLSRNGFTMLTHDHIIFL